MAEPDASGALRKLLVAAEKKRADANALNALVREALAVAQRTTEADDGIVETILAIAVLSASLERGQLAKEALRLAVVHRGAGDPSTIPARRLLAGLNEADGENAAALDQLLEVLAIEDSNHVDPTFTLRQVVYAMWDLGRGADAIPYAERKLALRRSLGLLDEDLLVDVIDVGLSLRDGGRKTDALAALRHAHRIAASRADIPDLRAARASALAEIEEWIRDLE